MATEKKISLLITAKDTASSVVKGVGAGVSKIAAGIKNSFKMIGGAATGINQGLEIAKKALQLLGAAYGATVGKALELRAANDPARKSIEDMGKATDKLGASVGDALIPVISALTGAVTPVIKSLTEWVGKNKEVIAATTIEGITKIGTVLIDVVEPAVKAVLLAWNGWKLIAQEAPGWADSIEKSFKSFIDSSPAAIAAAKLVGNTVTFGLAGPIMAATDGVKALGAGFIDAANEAVGIGLAATPGVKAVGELADKARAGLAGLGDVVDKNLVVPVIRAGKGVTELGFGFGRLIDVAQRSASTIGTVLSGLVVDTTSLVGVNERLIELAKDKTDAARLAELNKLTEKRTFLTQSGLDAEAAANAKRKEMISKDAEDAKAALDEIKSTAGTVVGGISSGIQSMVGNIASGTMEAGAIAGGFLLSLGSTALGIITGVVEEMVTTWLAGQIAMALATDVAATNQVAANTAAGASGAIAAYAGIPFVGIALGLAAAVAVIAAIASVASFAEGGMVSGGRAGVDSVPIMAMGGEYVTPQGQVQENVRNGRAPGDNGGPRPGGGGGGTTIVLDASNKSFMPEASAAFDRRINRSLIPALKRAQRSGRTF